MAQLQASTVAGTLTTTGNVGIGTNNVSTRLRVNNSSTQYLFYDSFGNLELYTPESQTGYVRLGAAYNLNGVYGSNGFNYVVEPAFNHTFRAQGTALMTITGGGNVGIGITNPGSKFVVVGNGEFTDTLIVSKGASDTIQAGSSLYLVGGSGASYTQLQQGVGRFIIFGFNGSSWIERFTINNTSGNVGIGTNDPGTYKLNVSGWLGAERIYPYNTNSTYLRGDSGGVTVSGIGYFYSDANGGSYFQGPVRFRSTISDDTNAYLTINGGTSGRTYFSGNVGIGLTNPTTDSILHVRRAASGVTARTDLGGTIIAEGSTRAGLYILTSGTAAGSYGSIWWGNGNTNTDAFISVENDTRAMRFGTADGTRMSILAAGNVGIGTNSPSYRLDVNGNIRAGLANSTALLVQASGTATTQAAIAIQQLTGEGDTIIFADYEPFAEYGIIARNSIDSIDFTGGTNTAGNLDSYTITNRSGAARTAYVKARIGLGSGNSLFGGNVGIGTATPFTPLHIARAAATAPVIRLQTTDSTTNGAIQWTNSTNTQLALIGSNYNIGDGSGNLEFATGGGSTRMVITSGGNVGINTNNPTTLFHLQGSNLMATLRNSSTSANQYTQIEFIAGSRDAYIWLGNQNTTNWAGDGGLNIYTGTGNMDFWTAATQKMRLTSGGNLGISTLSPGYKLDVNGGSDITVARFYNSGTTSTIIRLGDTGNSQYSEIIWDANTSAASIFKAGTAFSGYGGANSFNIYNQTGPIAFHPNNISNAMFIASSGNVGIGTPEPQKALEVIVGANNVASVGVAGLGLGNFAGIHFGYRESNLFYRKSAIVFERTDLTANDAQGKIHILNGPQGSAGSATLADAKITIAESGNVGIGNTNPGRKLDVLEGNVQIVANFQNTNTTSSRIKFTDANTGAENVNIGATGTSLAMWTNNAVRMTILSGGNVGIGTTSPGWKLDVVGNARIGDNTAQKTLAALNVSAGQGTATTYRDIDMHGSWSAGEGHAITATYDSSATNIVGQIVFEHNSPGSRIKFGRLYDSGDQSTYPMNLVSNGSSANLGIGTTAPAARLHVNGTLRVDNGGSEPGTNSPFDPGAVEQYYGGSQTTILGRPDDWLAINVSGVNYVIPLYTPG